MPKKYLIGLVALLVLALAVWLVPLALASSGDATERASTSTGETTSQNAADPHQCPYLQAHGQDDDAYYGTFFY